MTTTAGLDLTERPPVSRLVDTLERRYMLALVLVERLINDRTVLDLNIGLRRGAQPGERVLHPVLVVTLYDK